MEKSRVKLFPDEAQLGLHWLFQLPGLHMLSFPFGPTFNTPWFLEISLDTLLTDISFFLLPKSHWLHSELRVTLMGQTFSLLTPCRGWISQKCYSIPKPYICRIVNLCPLISSLECPAITALRYIGENFIKQRKRSKAEWDLLHLGFWVEQLSFTKLFFSSLIWAVPEQNEPSGESERRWHKVSPKGPLKCLIVSWELCLSFCPLLLRKIVKRKIWG